MTVVLFISCVYGSWKLIQFQGEKILGPAIELWGISSSIQSNEEERSKLNGYIDTTDFDIRIREAYADREERFYNNADPVIRWFSTTNDLAQFGVIIGALAVCILLIYSWVNFFVMLFKPDQKQEKKAKPAKRG
jgi:hypothetical protein